MLIVPYSLIVMIFFNADVEEVNFKLLKSSIIWPAVCFNFPRMHESKKVSNEAEVVDDSSESSDEDDDDDDDDFDDEAKDEDSKKHDVDQV